MTRLLVWLWLILLALPGLAQQRPTRLTGKVVDPRQYDEIKNSPYLFDTFMPAILVPLSGEPITDVAVNFNGHTQVFELEKDGIRVEMEIGLLIGVQVQQGDSLCGLPTFLKLLNRKLINEFPLFVYQGTRYKLVRDFRVTLSDNKVETPGKTVRFKTFNRISDYYIMEGRDLEPIRLSRNDVLRRFDDPAAQAFVDAEGLDLGTEQGVCTLLNWLEER